MWLSSSWYDGWLCHLNKTHLFSSLWCEIFLCFGDSNEENIYMIIDKKSNQWLSIYYKIGVTCILVIIIISNI